MSSTRGSWIRTFAIALAVASLAAAGLAQGATGAGDSPEAGAPAGDVQLAAVTAPAVLSADDDVVPRSPTPEEEGFRSEVERAWFGSDEGLNSAATRARATAFALGIENLDAAARALIAADDPENALANATLAVRLAPDLPVAHVALAQALFDDGQTMASMDQTVNGVLAIFRNFEAMAWLVGSLLLMVAIVMVATPLLFMTFVAISVFRRAAHDLGDPITRHMPDFARAALLGCLLLVPLALGEGVMGLVLALLALGIVYGSRRHRMALGLAVVFFVAGLYPVARTAGTALVVLESDPVARATMAVVQGIESERDVALLEAASGDEFLAQHILAVRARRLGRVEEATQRYAALYAEHPRNAEILTNYANLRFRGGDDAAAVELYERAVALLDSARVMFNLSQANARLFRIEEFEAAMRSAQELDAGTVAELSRIGDSDFVADLGFPLSALRSRLLAAAKEQGTSQIAVAWLMPGWLGGHPTRLLGALALVIGFGIFLASRFEQASSCTRCGKRICGRCDGTVWNAETCDACHHLFHRPETTDPKLRMQRLYELQARDARLGKLAFLASLFIPGAAGLLARRPDLGFLGILSCGFAVVFLGWPGGVVPDPLAVGEAGTLAFLAAGSAALFCYALIVTAGLVKRRQL
ncbi:MAG: hypothetical protein QF570_20975 [Myxococcota bacterium]|nr:hypothetical protein [Myxococcota bacterium]